MTASLSPVDLQALLEESCPAPEELSVPGPGRALAEVRPASTQAVARVVHSLRQAMLPWTVGPLDGGDLPQRALVLVDISRLNKVSRVKVHDGLVQAEGGVRLETMARLIRGEGYHADPLPPRIRLGRALAGPRARLRFPGGTGPSLADRVISLGVVLPDGSRLDTPLAPRRATGPDLAALLMGSRGVLGVVVSATLRVDPLDEEVARLGFLLEDDAHAKQGARVLLSAGLPLKSLSARGRVLSLYLHGMPPLVRAARKAARRILDSVNGGSVEPCEPEEIQPELPQSESAPPEILELNRRLRRVLDPAGLLLSWEEALGGRLL